MLSHLLQWYFEKPPESVFGYGHIGEFGSDEQGAALLKYDKGEIADLSFALRTNAVNEAYVLGTEGYIKIDEIFAVPTKATLVINGKKAEVIEEPIIEGGFNIWSPGSDEVYERGAERITLYAIRGVTSNNADNG